MLNFLLDDTHNYDDDNIITAEITEEEKPPVIMDFNYNIILNTKAYKELNNNSLEHDLVRDVTDEKYSDLSDEELHSLDRSKYINVVQKSPSWLKLRAMSSGTASNIGKYLYNSRCRFPTMNDIKKSWKDKIANAPFVKSITTNGHMSWGVAYEDAALIHLAVAENIGIIQVGAIRVDLSQIIRLGKNIFKDKWHDINDNVVDKYILVSPDGIVGKPEPKIMPGYDMVYNKIVGMLEIKCISPFYHLETESGHLSWCHNMDKRQWYAAKDIPYVYIIQQALQAISGIIKYKMKSTDIMWFIRWSPEGFSTFKFGFLPLVKLGVLAANLYFSLYARLHTDEDIDLMYPYEPLEQIISEEIE